MILSVSRRTDIPAFFGEWFVNRLNEGFVCVRNPFNKNMVSKIKLNPAEIDCIVFWTKDATNFINYLEKIDKLGYKYYFQYTITPYDKEIEPNLKEKNIIIDNFIELSKKLGKEKVVWRYDPILITKNISLDWHIKQFENLCKKLSGYTNKVVVSFLDEYKKLDKSKFRTLTFEEIQQIGKAFAKIASGYGLTIQTCAENIDIEGVVKGACIDKALIEQICGHQLNIKKDKTQREACLCSQSVDIGEYDTCCHFCEYCYANNNKLNIKNKLKRHNINSPLLVGNILPTDKIYERK